MGTECLCHLTQAHTRELMAHLHVIHSTSNPLGTKYFQNKKEKMDLDRRLHVDTRVDRMQRATAYASTFGSHAFPYLT